MKILAFTDTHGSDIFMEKIKKKSIEADILVCAGDITIFEQRIKKIVKEFSKINKEIIIIHGNHESEETLKKECKKYGNIHFIHKKIKEIKGIRFIGYGGGGFEYTDKKLDKWNPKINAEQKNVLITHAPPYGTKLDDLEYERVGNQSIREFILKNKINLAISGHIHETFEKEDKIKETKVINPGPEGKIIKI